MSIDVALKLLGLFSVIATGWGAARFGVFNTPDSSRALSNAAFLLFGPALLFRTTATMAFDFGASQMLVAFFSTTLLAMALLRAWTRWRAPADQAAATAAVRTVSAGFGNGVQVGIPMASVLFGAAGLQLHLTIISLHSLVLLSACTVWAELDVARARARADGSQTPWGRLMLDVARNALIHPVVLPVLLGLGWNALGWTIPSLVDGTLELLGQAMVPLCLVLIGVSLHEYGLGDAWQTGLQLAALKLIALPALVLLVAWGLFGLSGLPLSVVVMYAALPTGSNALLLANRYATGEADATATIVLATGAYMLTAPAWLALLATLH